MRHLKLTIPLLLALLLFCFSTSASASTEKRVALVIGNGAYRHATVLANPGNDARAVAAAMGRLGFAVTTMDNVGKSALERGLAAFRGQSRGADLAVLYYAGHAVQIEGRNYIVPVDAEVRELGDVSLNLVTLNAALQQMEAQVNVVILDACRDNPFADDLNRSAARLGRNLGAIRGLAREEAALGSGAYLMMAAAPERMALDGPAGGHSPYTAALLQHLERPGLELRMLHAHVRETVEQRTNRAQSPEAIDRLPPRPIYFAPSGTGQTIPPPPESQADDLAAQRQRLEAEIAAQQARLDQDRAALAEAERARREQARLDDLAAEQQRLAEETKKVEAERQRQAQQDQQVAMGSRPPTTPATRTWKEPHTGMEFVWVPGGCFQMGSTDGASDEKPVHQVCVDGFWMGKYEVTQAQWERVMGSNPARFKGPNNPVERVSWNDAQEFIRKLNSQSSPSGFRLPTEAEWEYAARGGTRTKYWWGDTFSCDKAMCENDVGSNEDSCVSYVRGRGLTPDATAPVGSYPPNPFGLYDTAGNVWEWVEDIYNSSAYAQPNRRNNPKVTGGGSDRVRRGGSWGNVRWIVRSANRNGYTPDDWIYLLGFRLLRTP